MDPNRGCWISSTRGSSGVSGRLWPSPSLWSRLSIRGKRSWPRCCCRGCCSTGRSRRAGMEADPWLSESVGERLLWSNPLHFNCSFNLIFDGHSPQFGSAPCFPTHSVVICPERTFEHLWMWFRTLSLHSEFKFESELYSQGHRAAKTVDSYLRHWPFMMCPPTRCLSIFHLLPNICEGN